MFNENIGGVLKVLLEENNKREKANEEATKKQKESEEKMR